MKFGKLADLSQVDFSLPANHSKNESLLAGLPKNDEPKTMYIGCTGWSMKEWIGKVYPKGTKPQDFLKYYAQQFNTIELNTTHYRIPNISTIEKWYKESTSDFNFCPKIPQQISHRNDLGYGSGAISAFCEAIQGLQEKLGHSFMQVPPYFGSDRLPMLQHFLENFPSHIPLAIEFRQESWFQSSEAFETLAQVLEKHRIPMVITDVAGRRDVLHQRLTSATAMIRFVGNGLIDSDYTRIDAWITRLKTWFDQGLQRVYFFPHEPDNILAPELAAYVAEQVAERLAVVVRGPDLGKYAGGDQMSLFG